MGDGRKEHDSGGSTSMEALNTQLAAHGYCKRPLRLDKLSSSEQAQVATVIYELLGASVSNLSSIEDVNARLRSTEYERDRLGKFAERNERAVARLEGEVEAAKARAAEAERRAAESEERVKGLKEDVARARKAVENIRVAAAQESKRAQLKLDKVLGQLARAVPAAPPTFELLNPIAPGAVSPTAGPIPLLEQGLRDLADLRASLQEETEAFRHVIVSTANALSDALGEQRIGYAEFFLDSDSAAASSGGRRIHGQVASRTSHPAIADARLRALTGAVGAALAAPAPTASAYEDQLEAREEAARRERERTRAESDLRDRVKDLEVEIAIARGKEEEAKRVIEEMARQNVQGSVPSTTDFEDARLRAELVRQKRLLDSERDALRDEAVRVGEERVRLDSDRAAWDAERSEAERQAEQRAQAEAQARQAQAQAQAEADTDADAEPAHASTSDAPYESNSEVTPPEQTAPRTPPKIRHAPASPSPLSPHKRSPGVHVAKRRGRTPLSRLVLERAHRKSAGGGGGAGSASAGASAGPSTVLGEGGKRGNAPAAGVRRVSATKKSPGVGASTGPRKVSGGLMAGTAASLARSARGKEALRSEAVKEAKGKARAWR